MPGHRLSQRSWLLGKHEPGSLFLKAATVSGVGVHRRMSIRAQALQFDFRLVDFDQWLAVFDQPRGS